MVDAIPFAMPPSLGFSIGVKVAEVLHVQQSSRVCVVFQHVLQCMCLLVLNPGPPPFPLSLFTLYCWMPLSLSGPLHHSQNQTSRNEPCFSLSFPCSPPVISLCLHLNRVTPKPPSQQQIAVSLYSEYCALLSPQFTLLSEECRRVLGSAA